jgi:hypothetical protein
MNTHPTQQPLKYSANKSIRSACVHAPCLMAPPGCCICSSVVLDFSQTGLSAYSRGFSSVTDEGGDGGRMRCLTPSVFITMGISWVVGGGVEGRGRGRGACACPEPRYRSGAESCDSSLQSHSPHPQAACDCAPAHRKASMNRL